MKNIGSDPEEIEGLPHYYGQNGERYFGYARQEEYQKLGALMNSHFWKPYVVSSDDVLDFGCGSGGLLSVLECRSRVGVDINPVARLSASQLGIDVYSSLSELEGRKFSKIISCHALEHCPNPYRVLVECRKLLCAKRNLLLLIPMADWRSTDEKIYKFRTLDMGCLSC